MNLRPYFLTGIHDLLSFVIKSDFWRYLETLLAIRVATSKVWMPLSNAAKAPLQEQRENSENSHIKKRRHSSENQNRSLQTKKLKQEDVTTEMADTQKRANFSALNSPSNGFSRHASPLANNKPGSAKKLVIKNFKGSFTSRCKLEYRPT